MTLTEDEVEVELVIVGGGPVGLAARALLGRAGHIWSNRYRPNSVGVGAHRWYWRTCLSLCKSTLVAAELCAGGRRRMDGHPTWTTLRCVSNASRTKVR